MNTQKFDTVPGLFLFSEYFPSDQCQAIIEQAFGLYEKLEKTYSTQQLQEAHIPQPEFVRSARHNLSSEESFVKVKITQSSERKPNERELSCEYFPRYGEDGHALAYFRGNANLPGFIDEKFLSHLCQNLIDIGITPPEGRTQWKLTVNYYKSIADSVAGFPFHVDIPSNGVITMIMNVQRAAQFQIAKDNKIEESKLDNKEKALHERVKAAEIQV